jgi:hypothetical protein
MLLWVGLALATFGILVALYVEKRLRFNKMTSLVTSTTFWEDTQTIAILVAAVGVAFMLVDLVWFKKVVF